MPCETILLVEDEPLLRLILSEGLEDEGFDVKSAPNADTGWTMICEGLSFDILVTDVVMPGVLDGLGLARLVARSRPKVRIVVMSGFTTSTYFDGSIGRFLSKPFTSRQLISTIISFSGSQR